MGVAGPAPWQSEKGHFEYSAHVAFIRRRVRVWVTKLPETNSFDNGFMASVMALRVLVEAVPHMFRISIVKGEVDSWEEAYTNWFQRTKHRFPKNIDPETVKAQALEEFAKLRELGVRLPAGDWQSATRIDLRTAARQEAVQAMYDAQQKAENSKEKSRESLMDIWTPCKLVAFPESLGEPRYSLIFKDFGSSQAVFDAVGAENNGYVWSRLVQAEMREGFPTAMTDLIFDPESSMLAIRCSTAAHNILQKVREVIARFHSEPQYLQQRLKEVIAG